MTEMTGLPGNESSVRRAVDKVAWAGQLEEDCSDRADETGQEIFDRTSVTGQLGQDSRDGSDWTSRPQR
jgi:hypothetical protein